MTTEEVDGGRWWGDQLAPTPMFRQLHEIRERLEADNVPVTQKRPTETEVEGTMEDMWNLGAVDRLGDDQYRHIRFDRYPAHVRQIADDLRWWQTYLDVMYKQRVKIRKEKGE